LWDVVSGQLLQERHVQPAEGVALRHRGKFSADGRLLLQPEGHTGDIRFGARLWDIAEGKLRAVLLHDHHVHDIAFSPDGTSVVTSSQDHFARIWETAKGTLRGSPLEHREPVQSVAISPSGHLVATVSGDQTARIWNMSNGRPVGPPLLHGHDLRDVDFSIDDATVVTACRDGSVRVWDLAAGPKWWWAGALDSAEDVFYLNDPLDMRSSSRWGAVLKHPKGVSVVGIHGAEPRLVTPGSGTKTRWAQASEDGERILLGGDREGIREYRLWSTATGQPLAPAFALGDNWALADVNADASILLAGTVSKGEVVLQVWNTMRAQPTSPLINLLVEPDEKDPPHLTADGATIVVVRDKMLHVFNAADG
jgi:WD40 repeat protein